MKSIFLPLASLSLCRGELFSRSGWLWQNPLPQGNTLCAVKFTGANTGTAVGQLGTILRMTTGGVVAADQNPKSHNTNSKSICTRAKLSQSIQSDHNVVIQDFLFIIRYSHGVRSVGARSANVGE